MTRAQLEFLESMTRRELRRKEDALAAFRAKPGQPAEEAEAAREKLAAKVDFVRATLVALKAQPFYQSTRS